MHTMKKRDIRELMGDIPLKPLDAVRLIIEAVEELGAEGEGLSRTELLSRLRRMLRCGVTALRAELQTVDFATAAAHSIAARCERRPTTRRDLRHFVQRMLRSVEGLAERPLRSLGVEDCRRILQQAFGNSRHSYRKGRVILHSIFAHGERHGWCGENPVRLIPAPVPQEKSIPPLSLEEVRRLEQAARLPEHRSMQLSLALMIYGGVRPAEICRLCPERDILWAERQVLIRPGASKTGGGRVVPLRAAARLKREPCIIPKNWAVRWRMLRRAAGFRTWRPDALRHTFASYHAAHYRNLHELQLEMGHRNAQLLYTRYVMPTSRRDAAIFFEKMTL